VPNRAITESRFKGVRFLVTAEIVKYSDDKYPRNSILGIIGSKNTGSIDLIFKVIEPQSRQILYTQSISVASKPDEGSGLSLLGIRTLGNSKHSQAFNNVIAKAVVIMCNKLAENAYMFDSPSQEEHRTELIVNNTNYPKISQLKVQLKELSDMGIFDTNDVLLTKFGDSVATILINHKGTTNDLLELLVNKLSRQIEVTNVDKDTVNLIIKE
jgi:hypothetical protein